MPSGQPLVSVVIATYNRADILQFAIHSVLLNERIDLEVIVVGDGCTDHYR
jgi:glycosyltransferase involved in cell wall biosynthesis